MMSEGRPIAGVTKSMSYTYNLDGSVANMTYPMGWGGLLLRIGAPYLPLCLMRTSAIHSRSISTGTLETYPQAKLTSTAM